ncbi:MAG: hypothetical protein Q4E36_03065 [Bacillota bacterium]|nr:hypothetical protein [Bacillota bacterium]
MKTKNKIFLISTIALSYLGFFGIGFLNVEFNNITKNPFAIILFILATLVPGLIGIILVDNRKWMDLKNINLLSILFFIGLLLVHMLVFSFFGQTRRIDDLGKFIFALVVCTFAFGLQEIGWIDLVFQRYLEEKGLFKSIVIIGLFKSLTFLPLTLLEGSPIDPNVFAYFSVFVIGLSSFSLFLRYYSKSALLSGLFIGFAYGLMSFMDLNLGPWLLIIGFIEVIFVYGLQDLIRENIFS